MLLASYDQQRGFDIELWQFVADFHSSRLLGCEPTTLSIFEMPENGPAGFKELIYSFDYENAHFIGLDTDIYSNFHMLGATQLEWLKNDLEKNTMIASVKKFAKKFFVPLKMMAVEWIHGQRGQKRKLLFKK